MTRQINVSMLGSKFMGRAHSNAWATVGHFFDVDPLPVMQLVCARNGAELADFAARWGWAKTTTDWREAVTSDEVDLVDVATPNNVHAQQAIAALEAGKHVACEKPLAGTLADAEAMAAAAAAAPDRRSSGSTTAGCRPSRWPTSSSPRVRSAASTTCVPPTCRVGEDPTPHCCGASKGTSPVRVRTAISTPTSSTWCASSRGRRS